MPKNNIEMDVFELVLKIFYNDGGWIDNETLIERLKEGYRELGRNQETGPEGYTKKAQIPAYFGFILWEDNSRSARKMISSSGRNFYEALITNNTDRIAELLIESLQNTVFGRNNSACKSDSDIEGPKLFIVSSIILGGLNFQEFAYIIGELIINRENYPHALVQVRQARKSGTTLPLSDDVKKFRDAKPITFLERCGLLERVDDLLCVKETVLDLYTEELANLSIFNTVLSTGEPIDDLDDDYNNDNNKVDYSNISPIMKNFIEALKTKPFLLLAGISGTGKSQKVKELAFLTCPKDGKLNADSTTPGNYCLIEVKPNWHDSTELLGYYSNLTEKYTITPFLHFLHKAATKPDVPFFVCLDEMNLAPVEQYFAEYLSVLETRTMKDGKIESAELLSKKLFESCAEDKGYSGDELKVLKYLKENGLRLPENLFVIGTVNMDDTTHQFSRKVIDRAFTIEMNGDELEEMFADTNAHVLEYTDSPLPLSELKPKFVKANDALADDVVGNFKDAIIAQVPERLKAINAILKDTPFRVSYRVQNEFVLYLSTLLLKHKEDETVDDLINKTTLVILLEKILPRVQGDEKLLSTADGNVFTDLTKYVNENLNCKDDSGVLSEVLAKLDEMDKRLSNTYFANFF